VKKAGVPPCVIVMHLCITLSVATYAREHARKHLHIAGSWNAQIGEGVFCISIVNTEKCQITLTTHGKKTVKAPTQDLHDRECADWNYRSTPGTSIISIKIG